MLLCTDTHIHTSLIPDQWLWVLDSPETCCYWDAERLPMVGLSPDCAPLLHSSLRSSVCQYPENATLEPCLTRGLSNLAWCEHLHKHRCVCVCASVCECVRACSHATCVPSSLCMYLWLRACGCRAISLLTSSSLFFSLVKADPGRHYAVMVGSHCANVTRVLSLCHLCLLPAVPSDTSGTVHALFLTRNPGDCTHRHTHKHTHSLTHTYRYLMENRNTEETPTKISTGRKIHITFRDHPFYKMYHIDFYGYALYMSYYLIIHRIKECDVFKLL